MLPSVKYSRLPSEADEKFHQDFSSPFTYDDQSKCQWKYQSPFTYNENVLIEIGNPEQIKTKTLSSDNAARALVMFGFFVVYILTLPIMIWFSVKRIKVDERFVIFRLGRLHTSKGPGYALMLPLLDRCHKIDIRLKAFSVPPKQVITSDGAIIEVGAEIYFQIVDAEKSVTNVQDLNRCTRVLLQTSLGNIMCQKTLAQIESERREIANTLLESSNKTCNGWGVEITRAELSQIKTLSEPQPRATPTVMMPPGLMGPGAETQGGLPSALMQMASALASNQGGTGKKQAVAEALQAISQPLISAAANMSVDSQTDKKAKFTHESAFDAEESEKSNSTLIQNLSPEGIVSAIKSVLSPNLVQRVGATYQFNISGENGGTFFLDLVNDYGCIGSGVLPQGEPDVHLDLSLAELQALLKGEVKPFEAYMSGRLQVSGDKATAMKLSELVKELQANGNGKG